MGNLTALIAGANQGKSYFAKEILISQKGPCFVYDIQNCYGSSSTKPGDLVTDLPLATTPEEALTRYARCRFFGTPDEFIEIASQRRNSTIVIEEATIFLEGKTQPNMRKLMVDRFHHKNNIIIMFHSVNSINPRILEMSDYIVLFKTGDSDSIIKRKCPKIYEYFKKLQRMPDRSKKVIKNI